MSKMRICFTQTKTLQGLTKTNETIYSSCAWTHSIIFVIVGSSLQKELP